MRTDATDLHVIHSLMFFLEEYSNPLHNQIINNTNKRKVFNVLRHQTTKSYNMYGGKAQHILNLDARQEEVGHIPFQSQLQHTHKEVHRPSFLLVKYKQEP